MSSNPIGWKLKTENRNQIANGFAKAERGGVCIIITKSTDMFQPHKGVKQHDPRNVKRRTILVIQKFQHPNVQASVFDHLLNGHRNFVSKKKGAMQFCFPIGSGHIRHHYKVEVGNASEEMIN